MTIDTLHYAKALQASGVTAEQAEVHAETLASAFKDSSVSKADIAEIKGEIGVLTHRLDSIDRRQWWIIGLIAVGVIRLFWPDISRLLG